MADTTAPILTGLDLPDVVDLSGGDATHTFSASGRDENEIDKVVVWFDKPIPQFGSSYSLVIISSGWEDGTGTRSLTFDDGMVSGTYNVTKVDIQDSLGNERTISAAKLAARGFDTEIVVKNPNVLPPDPDFKYQLIDSGGTIYLDVVYAGSPTPAPTVDFDATLGGSGYTISSFELVQSGTSSSQISSTGSPSATIVNVDATASVSGILGAGETVFRMTLDVSSVGTINSLTSDLSLGSSTQFLPELSVNHIGTNGADTMHGTSDANGMLGSGGNDKILAFSGDDQLFGGNGNDRLNGGGGADRLDGGAGRDRADYSSASAKVRADLENVDRNTGEAEGDTYKSIENLLGSKYGDVLAGSGRSNYIWGGNGNDALVGRSGGDKLYGGSGNDRLNGGGGNDLLRGDSGSDVLTGASGADTFVFSRSSGNDTITDFDANEVRSGSVCLNSFRAAVKWISALVTPPPGLASAG